MKPLSHPAISLALMMGITSAPLTAQSPTDYDRQIEQLMNHPAVRTALDHIVETDELTMDDLMTLTQIPAPPFMEEERAAAFLQMMIDLGVDSAWTDEVGNVIGLRRGSGYRRSTGDSRALGHCISSGN